MIYRVAPQPSARARVRSHERAESTISREMPALKEILSPSRRHDLRHRCGEVVGVDPVIAAAIVERPDTHPDVDGRANTMTVMASERGDDEMLLLRLQAREPRLDR